jgi:hypothetical protein
VVRDLGASVELRDYPAHTLISCDVPGSFDGAANRGFGPLVRYISGDNRRSQHIAMTAPVLHEPQRGTHHTISFVLPEGMTVEDAPVPANAAVVVHEVRRRQVAVLRFSGGLGEAKARDSEARLRGAVQASGLTAQGEVFFALYDPPWKPGFLRRTEALVAVEGTLNQ